MTRKKGHAEPPADEAARKGDPAVAEGEPAVADGATAEPADPRDAEIERLRAREEDLLRGLAELSNAHRRRKQEMEQSIRYAQESLIRDLLPVLDDFERALAAIPGGEDDPIRAGVLLVRDRLVKTLEREGLVAIRPKGEPFDPNRDDAVLTQPPPDGVEPDTILEVVQTGYRLGERILRHTKVVVAGAHPEEES
ncbi:MAG: nucleotide exchange factor GrpE [Hyphomicrobiales bacterium]